ncbi:phage portal protein [Polaribacter haliotis]|uniref:Phage portal protein n=1 Tax=Polaribacter haliotis TaxID=1888915 RepID=A0A7L8AF61_9FLAO|nr:phage portal protein [Polaribacter haliotis]QOD60648.1 phage portal protein [Polaribacter haliotis]
MFAQAIQHNNSTRSAVSSVGGSGLFDWFGGGSVTKNGTPVNTSSAKTLSAFYNGITILCNDYAKLPKSVIIKNGNTRIKDASHPVNRLLNKRPNPFMSAFNYDSIMMQCAILKGNAYSEKITNPITGKVEARQFINENDTPVTVKKFNGKLWYHFDGRVVPAKDMEHIIGFSENGITGIGVVAYAAKSLGVALSSQEFAEEYYASRGVGMAVMTSSKSINPDAKTRVGNSIESRFSSKSNYKVAVIDEAESFQHISLTPQESMFLETNKHAIGEVARWLNIPSHKLKDTENSNYSNMESQNIDHISNSVLPWSMKFRQEQDEKLFTEAEIRQGYQVHHNSNSLLEADKKTQAEFISKMLNNKVFVPNQIREMFDMNPLEGGDVALMPLNMQTEAEYQLKLEKMALEIKKLKNE